MKNDLFCLWCTSSSTRLFA